MGKKAFSPVVLNRVTKINVHSKKEDRVEALKELASELSDTRNMIAHAKTNYIKKGKECPDEQMINFAKCCRLVAIQVIRWCSSS